MRAPAQVAPRDRWARAPLPCYLIGFRILLASASSASNAVESGCQTKSKSAAMAYARWAAGRQMLERASRRRRAQRVGGRLHNPSQGRSHRFRCRVHTGRS
eukprot:1724185-Prymnesium_polylepis.1